MKKNLKKNTEASLIKNLFELINLKEIYLKTCARILEFGVRTISLTIQLVTLLNQVMKPITLGAIVPFSGFFHFAFINSDAFPKPKTQKY